MYNQSNTNLRTVVSMSHQRSNHADKKHAMMNRSKTRLKNLSGCFQKTIKSLDEIAREDVKYTKELFDKSHENDIEVTFDEQDDPFDV
jgi:hypothetical protein